MAPTAIFHFFEKSSGRFFEVGHFYNFINVQNLRGTSEILGKTGVPEDPRDFRGGLRLVIVVVVEDSETFVALVGAG
jgi:hypothetical protein